ncbi:MAG TPA: NAD(+) synthase [Polyangiaceae bacterium]
MRCIRVAVAALNQTPLAWDQNKANIVDALRRAREAGATFLCLPELCLTGYGCEDAFLAPGTLRMAERVLEEVLPETRGMVVSLGLPVEFGKAIFNACCLVADGEPRGIVAKHALAGDGLHYEPRWFKPWPLGRRSELTLCGVALPFGDLEFECDGVRLAFEICEDAWVAHRPAVAALSMADVVFNPSASHFAFGKHEIRKRLVLESSRAFGVCYVYSNLLGNEAGRAIYDGDALIATHGRLLARTERFLFQEVTLVSAVVDVELGRFQHARLTGHQLELPEPGARVAVPLTLPPLAPEPTPRPRPVHWDSGDRVKEEEFTRAVALGLFDYLRKSRARGFVISLSGGADSAAVACLARFMLSLATTELGLRGALRKLGLPFGDGSAATEADAARLLITTVYQSTKNSSEVTKSAAAAVANALGTEHHELDVSALVAGYESLVADAIGRPLTWEEDDVSLQNIQARARAPSVWLFANLRAALLLSTSNRSEAAVGYATMDGDTAGGLSPIAGIDKAFLLRWLGWVENFGPSGIGRVPELAAVNRQSPTAELRPPGAAQTDEGDLMPYDLLDAIERSAVRDKRSPLEAFVETQLAFPDYSVPELGAYVERFFVLWSRNQWKRERYAPSFHVDDANLDPKTWCRFPILSGDFERELAELRAFVAEAR